MTKSTFCVTPFLVDLLKSLMKDSEFMTSNHVFTGLIKMLKRDGKDVTIHKKAISEGDIQKLYTSGVFG
jgi:hypothetical protein